MKILLGLIVLIFCSVPLLGLAQVDSLRLSKKTMSIVTELAKSSGVIYSVKHKAIGPKGYFYLLEKAEMEELILLTDHQSPTVRVYSFWALVERGYSNLTEIYSKHEDDKESLTVDYIESDIMGLKTTVSDLMRVKLKEKKDY